MFISLSTLDDGDKVKSRQRIESVELSLTVRGPFSHLIMWVQETNKQTSSPVSCE
jgi:hypothetical protein